MLECFYVTLEVAEDASAADIRKAYHRMALRYHPDKVRDGTREEAAERFKAIQRAYTVLSDANERAWYDAHKHQILSGGDGTRGGDDEVLNVFPWFSPTCYDDHGDGPRGFYRVYGDLFSKLWFEEMQHAKRRKDISAEHDVEQAPPFGGKDAAPSDVKAFYDFWSSFSTLKTFAWCDVWNETEAPNRRVRRAMAKENARERGGEKQEYNETIRALVAHVRKRDLREQRRQEEAQRSAAERLERQKRAAADRARQHMEQMSQYVAAADEQDTAEIDARIDNVVSELMGGERPVESSDEMTLFECVACAKVFKSDAQLSNHEKSKKHKKMEEKLKARMLREDAVLRAAVQRMEEEERDEKDEDDEEDEEEEEEEEDVENDAAGGEHEEESSVVSADEEAKAEEVTEEDVTEEEEEEAVRATQPLTKREKRRLRQAKKQAMLASGGQGAAAPVDDTPPTVAEGKKLTKRQAKQLLQKQGKKAPVCKTCNSVFESRTQLFRHLEDTGHAVLKK